jgi:hypothetical protein
LKKLRGGSLSRPQKQLILKPALDCRRVEFHRKGKIMMDNVIRKHTTCHYFYSCLKGVSNPVIPSLAIKKIAPIISILKWTIFGITFTGLSIFTV